MLRCTKYLLLTLACSCELLPIRYPFDGPIVDASAEHHDAPQVPPDVVAPLDFAAPPDVAMPIDQTEPGCRSDNECKGQRICVRGECVDPPVEVDLAKPSEPPIVYPDFSMRPDFAAPLDFSPPLDFLHCTQSDEVCSENDQCCGGICAAIRNGRRNCCATRALGGACVTGADCCRDVFFPSPRPWDCVHGQCCYMLDKWYCS